MSKIRKGARLFPSAKRNKIVLFYEMEIFKTRKNTNFTESEKIVIVIQFFLVTQSLDF